MATPTANSLNYIKPIDGIRGLLCIWVLLTHWDQKHFNTGWAAMGIFFLISGFLIGRILVATKDANFKSFYSNYLINRILRIFPLYYLTVGFFFGIMYWLRNATEHLSLAWAYHSEHWLNFGFHGVNLIKFFSPGLEIKGHNFLGHYWSLSVEEQFYFVFPFLIYFIRGRALKALLIFLIIGSPFFKYFSTVYFEQLHGIRWARLLTYEFTLYWLDAFAFGAALVVFDFKKITKPAMLSKIFLLTTIAMGFLIYYTGSQLGANLQIQNFGLDSHAKQTTLTGSWLVDYRFVIMSWLINLTSASLILCFIKGQNYLNFLNNNFLVFIGKRSFAMYVFHLPVLILLWEFEIVDRARVFANPYYDFFGYLIYLFGILLIAHLVYEGFEKQFLRFRRKYDFGEPKIGNES